MKKKKKNRLLPWITGVLLLLVISTSVYAYNLIFKPFSLSETAYIYIDQDKNYEKVVDQLKAKAGAAVGTYIPATGRENESCEQNKNRKIRHKGWHDHAGCDTTFAVGKSNARESYF